MSYEDGSDLKTYIPGVGFLVTSLETGESHMFPDPAKEEPVYDCLDCDKPIEQRPVVIGGQKCYQRYCDPCIETDLIVKMYQNDGLTPEAISIDLELPLQDVLAITDECDIASKDCDRDTDWLMEN